MIGLETRFFATELRQIKLFDPDSCQNSVRFGEKPGFFVVSTAKCSATAQITQRNFLHLVSSVVKFLECLYSYFSFMHHSPPGFGERKVLVFGINSPLSSKSAVVLVPDHRKS